VIGEILRVRNFHSLLSDDGETIRVIKASFPEADDDTPESDRLFSFQKFDGNGERLPRRCHLC
jgi:hypothetical protein